MLTYSRSFPKGGPVVELVTIVFPLQWSVGELVFLSL